MLGDADALANPGNSLQAYRCVLELRRAPGASPPSATLLNNAAVMHYRAGLYDTARSLFSEALEKVLEGAITRFQN
jgi:Flp pilus assembly protein TadD